MDNFCLEIHTKRDFVVLLFDKDWNGFFKRQEHRAGNHGKCIEHAGAAYKMQLYTMMSVR